MGGSEYGSGSTIKNRVTGSLALAAYAYEVAKNYGITVAMKNNHVWANKLSDSAGKSRLVPEGHGMLEVARRMGISLG